MDNIASPWPARSSDGPGRHPTAWGLDLSPTPTVPDQAATSSRCVAPASRDDDDGGQGQTVPVPDLLPGDAHASNTGEESPRRRARRRRNLTACTTCRLRKSKCDNKRPRCGHCVLNGARCIYSDRPKQSSSPDAHAGVAHDIEASPGLADVLLLKIDHLTNLVTELRSLPHPASTVADADTNDHAKTATVSLSPSHVESHPTSFPRLSAESAFSDDGFGRLEITLTAASTSATESLLTWPVVKEVYGGHAFTSFALECMQDGQLQPQPPPPPSTNPMIDGGDMWLLCKRFLALVHVKNPVLDVVEFKKHVHQITEHGVGWDGPSCLVVRGLAYHSSACHHVGSAGLYKLTLNTQLVACALACLATPYDANRPPSVVLGPDESAADKQLGETYFAAARKRLSLLPHSLMSFQCQYFAALYEKFAVRPFSAWVLAQQASVRFQAFLYAKALSGPNASDATQRWRHMEQRLYWSCVKAECELRAELQLPASGLLSFKYPDLFPALSLPSGSETLDLVDGWCGSVGQSPESQVGLVAMAAHGEQPQQGHRQQLQPEEERSWLYYLAEISLRKIMNRILDSLYGGGEEFWLRELPSLCAWHATFSEELRLWRAHLPDQIAFSDDETPQNELSFFLKTRFICCREWITRPFVYCVVSASPLMAENMRLQAGPYGQDCIAMCAELIPLAARHHRHGGIWALLRRSFGAALVLTVAASRPMCLQPPANWRELVRLSIATIQGWEEGVADLRKMRETLEHVVATLETSQSQWS